MSKSLTKQIELQKKNLHKTEIELQKKIFRKIDDRRTDFLFKVTFEARELFKKKYGSFDEAIGVFGRYPVEIITEEGKFKGEDLIIKLADTFANKNPISITGKGIFIQKKEK